MSSLILTSSAGNLPKIALVGRTNVGKSTLFNRLAGKYKALTSRLAGTTRDYYETKIEWQGKEFLLIDTGGLNINPQNEIDQQIYAKTNKTIKKADLLLLIVDGQEGLQPFDQEIYSQLKKAGKKIILVINKADAAKRWSALKLEFSLLGIEKMIPVSALNGIGTGDLLDELSQLFPTTKKNKDVLRTQINLAIIGKPNVGKSSLINAIIKKDKQIISAMPHTTRDAQDIEIIYHDHIFHLIDTAGVRRRTKKGDQLEKFSINQSLEKIKNAQVVALVIDISQPLTFQDKHLAQEILEKNKSLLLVANKWDLIPEKTEKSQSIYTNYLKKFFPFLTWVPIIFTSATEKKRTENILDLSLQLYQKRFRRITDNALDKFLKKMIKKQPPARGKGAGHPYIYHLTQVNTNPPTFEVMIKYKKSLHASYLRFLKNKLREEFSFLGTPLKIYVKSIK